MRNALNKQNALYFRSEKIRIENMSKRKKVLYISNIEVPYRVKFFNLLAMYCDLTVIYERVGSDNRDRMWSSSVKKDYKAVVLKGLKSGKENALSIEILKYVTKDYDEIIVGCINSKIQVIATLVMKILGIKYIVNLDGETFALGKSFKSIIKRCVLRGAKKYLVAGEKSAENLRKIVGSTSVYVYYFSSLYALETQRKRETTTEKTGVALVVGQYYSYKGLDVALKVAKRIPQRKFIFVGMGLRTDDFVSENNVADNGNVRVIPFLQKDELEELYKKSDFLVLPSRKECWGLVINEAAAFGLPVVSTWGSGAAVEFLSDEYPQLLAQPGNEDSLYQCIQWLECSNKNEIIGEYLNKKGTQYSIEKCVEVHKTALGII